MNTHLIKDYYCRLFMILLFLFQTLNVFSSVHCDSELSDSCFVAGVKDLTAYIYDRADENATIIDSLNKAHSFVICDQKDSEFYFVQKERSMEVKTDSGFVRTNSILKGYIRQKDVEPKNDEELLLLSEYMAMNKCSHGLVSDTSGYTEIRKERNANSEILDRVLKGENFVFWALPSGSFHIVQTETGIRGFVDKRMIKDKRPSFKNYQFNK